MSQELGVDGNICKVLDKYFGYTNKQKKIREEEYDSQSNGYRDVDEEERTEHINKELNKMPTHKKLQKLNGDVDLMDFDATSLYPSAMWDENSVYPKVETGFAFKPNMNNAYAEAFNNQAFKSRR